MPDIKFEPTAEQVAVIQSDARRLVVRASAGAGKTGTLVLRYLNEVRKGISPDAILAITFTRKAAAEMKERIVASLLGEGFAEQARIAETGPIQTIHSFCERLLRENSLLAGVDTRFTVLEETHAARMVESCLREILAEDWSSAPLVEKLIGRIAGSGRQPYGNLKECVLRVLSLRGTICTPQDVRPLYATPDCTLVHWNRCLVKQLPVEDRELAEGLETEDLTAFLRSKLAIKVESGPPAADLALAEDTTAVVQIALRVWERFEDEMRANQTFDFNYLIAESVRLIQRSAELRNRLAERYHLVVVDEAQDLDPAQHSLLELLEVNHLILVGDERQSIYRFREAEPALFQGACERFEVLSLTSNERSEAGVLNYINTVCQSFFTNYNPMVKRQGNVSHFEGVRLVVASEDGLAIESAIVEAVGRVKDDPNIESIGVLVDTNEQATKNREKLRAAEIDSAIHGGKEKYFNRLEIRDLANALRVCADRYNDFSFLALLRSPFVGVSMDTIAALATNLPVWGSLEDVARQEDSDGAKLREFLVWFEPISKYADRLPAYEVIGELYAKSPFLENLARRYESDRLIANARKLLQLACQSPEVGVLDFASQIAEIQRLDQSEAEASFSDGSTEKIQLMTVHMSKGLQFDAVVLAETSVQARTKNEPVLVDKKQIYVAANLDRSQNSVSIYYQFPQRLEQVEEEREFERRLYVALTRTRKRLIIVLNADRKQGKTWAQYIMKAVTESEALRRGAEVHREKPKVPR